MKKRYSISKHKCKCSLTDFYERAAKLANLDMSKDAIIDCRKINITEPVKNMIYRYYYEMGMTTEKIGTLFLHYGPKVNIDGDSYAFEICDGFIKKANNAET